MNNYKGIILSKKQEELVELLSNDWSLSQISWTSHCFVQKSKPGEGVQSLTVSKGPVEALLRKGVIKSSSSVFATIQDYRLV